MDDGYGSDFITITDDNGNEFELELLDAFEYGGTTYHAFVEAGHSQDEDLEIIILKSVEQDGEELLSTPDTDEELTGAYDHFMQRLFEDEEATADEV